MRASISRKSLSVFTGRTFALALKRIHSIYQKVSLIQGKAKNKSYGNPIFFERPFASLPRDGNSQGMPIPTKELMACRKPYQKLRQGYMANQARDLVKTLDPSRFTRWGKPGIRAQLLDTRTRKLVSDFHVEGDQNSLHILNAVSPAFTASLPFARWTIERFRSRSGWGAETTPA